MSADLRELKANMSKLSDEELLAIVGVNSTSYREEAIYFANEELTTRGIPFSSAGETAPPPTQDESRYRGVKGWLLLFCLNLTIFSPLYTLSMIGKIIEKLSTEIAQLSDRTIIIISICWAIFICLIVIGILLFGIYAGLTLWSVKYNALKNVKRYLLARLIFFVCLPTILIPLNIYFESQGTERISMTAYIFPLLYEAFWVAIWYSYFTSSKRVKATYVADANCSEPLD